MKELCYSNNSNVSSVNTNDRYGTSEYIESMLKAVEKSITRSLAKQVKN